jgi:hypothetical protein
MNQDINWDAATEQQDDLNPENQYFGPYTREENEWHQ